MIYSLARHPSHPSNAVREVSVELVGGHDDLLLTFAARDGCVVRTPEWKSPRRADGLWRTTCFELFLKRDGDERYFEFNFSPSTEWAAYSFKRYRVGMIDLERDIDPCIERTADGIEVDCDLGGLPSGSLKIALSAVIEETDGTKSYWALAHAPGPPDFHNPACFTATLPAPERP